MICAYCKKPITHNFGIDLCSKCLSGKTLRKTEPLGNFKAAHNKLKKGKVF